MVEERDVQHEAARAAAGARKAIADHRAGRTEFVPLSALDADG